MSRRVISKKEALKRRIITVSVLILILIGIIYLIIFKSPLLNVRKINVKGNENVSAEEIIKKSTFKKGFKTFSFDKKEGKELIEEIPEIKSANIKRRFPSTVNIEVVERVPTFTTVYNEQWIVMDDESYILEMIPRVTKLPMPDISGVDINNPKIGDKLIQGKHSEDRLEFIEMLKEKDLIEQTEYISFYDMDDIKLQMIDGEKVLLGDMKDLKEKFDMLIEILSSIEKEGQKVSQISLIDPIQAVISTDFEDEEQKQYEDDLIEENSPDEEDVENEEETEEEVEDDNN